MENLECTDNTVHSYLWRELLKKRSAHFLLFDKNFTFVGKSLRLMRQYLLALFLFMCFFDTVVCSGNAETGIPGSMDSDGLSTAICRDGFGSDARLFRCDARYVATVGYQCVAFPNTSRIRCLL